MQHLWNENILTQMASGEATHSVGYKGAAGRVLYGWHIPGPSYEHGKLE